MTDTDTAAYTAKKRLFSRMLTVFGRKPVLEALQDEQLKAFRLHLADSNKPAAILTDLIRLAEARGVEVHYHDKTALSRISKNSQQDQGVALDIECEKLGDADGFLQDLPERFELIAVDSVTNPQNLGMIIRSVCASPITGLLLPEKGCAKLDALVIKASAGTLFRARILRCRDLAESLKTFSQHGARVYGLDAHAPQSISGFVPTARSIYVLGNETDGLSRPVAEACTDLLSIPMSHGVESLNVGVAASLLAFRSIF